MVSLKMGQLMLMVDRVGESPLGNLGRLKTMSAKVTYRVAKAIKAVMEEVEAFEKARVELCKELGTLNPKTNNYDMDEEKQKEFQTSMAELLQQDVVLNILEVEIDPDAVGLTPSDMLILEPVIKVRET